MEIVGYVAYASFVILAIVWTVDVRINLGAETPAILRAVYFVTGAALVEILDVNKGHCLWLVPFGCVFARFIAPFLLSIPVLSVPFCVTANIFERIIRVGVPRHKIDEAQSASKQAGGDTYCNISDHNEQQ